MASRPTLISPEEYIQKFRDIVEGYNEGWGPEDLSADLSTALSWNAPGSGYLRDFSYIAPEIPEFIPDKCVGCMRCVTECPDTAILGKAVPESVLEKYLQDLPEEDRPMYKLHFAKTKKFYELPQRQGLEGAWFGIFIDPTKCKGCAECVTVCEEQGYHALRMIRKEKDTVPRYKKTFELYKKLPTTPKAYINERAVGDLMLAEDTLLYVGGAGSCAGCGEATPIRMMLAATAFQYGKENITIVAATGCNTVYGSTYPFNPFTVPWMNSLFENAGTVAVGVRMALNKDGKEGVRLWVLGGDGAMYDIGFQSLSRMLTTGLDIKVLILDTQVYSNTGGQASTASFMGQEAKMSAFGKSQAGKVERRKEIAQILMMHPDVYVAQTTAYHVNHFYKAIMDANAYPGPAVVNVYAPCQPEHGIADNESFLRARMAVYSRAFPLLVYDPRKGERIRERLSLAGNPAPKEDWYRNPKTGEVIDFVTFARGEGRFAKHFDPEGRPSQALLRAQEDRLKNWRTLQELAGLR